MFFFEAMTILAGHGRTSDLTAFEPILFLKAEGDHKAQNPISVCQERGFYFYEVSQGGLPCPP